MSILSKGNFIDFKAKNCWNDYWNSIHVSYYSLTETDIFENEERIYEDDE